MTLKDKMYTAIIDNIEDAVLDSDRGKTAEACAKIAEEDAIRFAEWIGKEDYRRYALYPDKWCKIGTEQPYTILKSSQELYTLYQQEKEKK